MGSIQWQVGSLQRQVAFFWYDNDKDANICFLVTQLIFLCLIYPQVEEFNIITNYAKLLPENKVPVGVWQCLSRAIFMCQLKETDTFGDCCEVSVIQFSILLPENRVPVGVVVHNGIGRPGSTFCPRLAGILCLKEPGSGRPRSTWRFQTCTTSVAVSVQGYLRVSTERN